MSEVVELLARLRERDIRLWVEEGRLRYSAPGGKLDPELRAQLVARRDEVVEFLRRAGEAGKAHGEAIEAGAPGSESAVSFTQQRLLFLEQLMPGTAVYHIALAVRLKGELDLEALEWSLREVVWRHEVLRTAIRMEEGRPALAVLPEWNGGWVVEELSGAGENEIPRLAREEAQRGFDLERGPLLRARVLRLGAADHVLLVTVHHVAFDGWSQGVLRRELGAFYRARVEGKRAQVEPLAIQYRDFAAWQQKWMSGGVLEGQLSYWVERLAGAPQVLDLPTDRARPATRSLAGARERFGVSREVLEGIEELSRREGVTPFIVLLAAYYVLLGRYTAQEDLVVGMPIANRNRAEIEGLIGFFVNTLALRVDLGGDPSFRELLGRVREAAMGAYAHQDLPFEVLVDELQVKRDLSRNPLFQVAFDFLNMPLEPMGLGGLQEEWLDTGAGTSMFDLMLMMEPEEGKGLAGLVEYSTDLFEVATIRRLIGHYQNILRQVVEDPSRRIGDISLLSGDERQRMLRGWNETAAVPQSKELLQLLFANQARARPEQPAVITPVRTLSYRELSNGADRMGRMLRNRGALPNTLVAIVMDKGWEQAVAVLGILNSGAAYLPIDPGLPKERLHRLLATGGVRWVLTQPWLDRSLPWPSGIERLTVAADILDPITAEPLSPIQSPTSLAYVIFTSGSTGEPKGVMIDHRGAINTILDLNRRFKVTPEDRVLGLSALTFDLSVSDLFGMFAAGAALVLPEPEGQRDVQHWLRLMERHRVTLWNAVPALMEMLVEFVSGTGAFLPEDLRLVFLSGDWIPLTLPDRIRKLAHQDIEFFGGGGTTEVSIWSSLFPIGEIDPAWTSIPYGKPLRNQSILILDGRMEPRPIGIPGDMYIGGIGVAQGYWGDEEKTRKSFVIHPQTGERLYRTGDLGRYLPDGNIEFLGREDTQVKVQGYRIELGEIETTLLQHPSVQAGVVAAVGDPRGQKRLVAYVVPSGSSSMDPRALQAHLSERLPSYMVPSEWMCLRALPLTPNGKVDRRALPKPGEARPERSAEFVAPRTVLEKELAAIWSEILGVERVGVHDDFFELGGNSIVSMQVVARAKRAGYRITPRQVFEQTTIAGLSSVIGQLRAERPEQSPVTGPVPLTPVQHWFFDGPPPVVPSHFNQAVLLEFRSPPAIEHLDQALSAVWRHHDGLRMRFEYRGASWRQEDRGSTGGSLLTRVDLSRVADADLEEASRNATAKAQASFDLSSSPLVRTVLLDRGQRRPQRILLAIHHLVVDVVSWEVLLEDLETAYWQRASGKAVVLPEKTTSYRRWAELLLKHAKSPEMAAEAAYWLPQQETVSPALPVDHRFGGNTYAEEESVDASLDSAETEILVRDAPKVHRAQVNEVLLTALAVAFSKWTGERAVFVDLEGHGREEILPDLDLTRTVGWFTSVFPVCFIIDKEASLGETLTSVKEQVRRIPSRGMSYGVLRYLANDAAIVERLRGMPRPQVSFNYLGKQGGALSRSRLFAPAGGDCGPLRSPLNERKHVLEIDGGIEGGRLRMTWKFSRSIHERRTIERVAGSFIESLREFVALCASLGAGEPSPEDFPRVKLDEGKLAAILKQLRSGN